MVDPKTKILQTEDGIGFVALIDTMQENALLKTVNAARISYKKRKDELDEKDQKLLSFLWEAGHTSPFRHSYVTFHIKAPLFVFRQWMKYQVGSTWMTLEIADQTVPVHVDVVEHMYDTDKGCSWNEISGRYVEFKEPEFYIPNKMRTNSGHGNKQASSDLPEDFDHGTARASMLVECKNAVTSYHDRLKAGIAKEIARMMLPQNLYSEAYWTVSLQGALHFLQQRLKPDAQYEIRTYAALVQQLIDPVVSELIGLAE